MLRHRLSILSIECCLLVFAAGRLFSLSLRKRLGLQILKVNLVKDSLVDPSDRILADELDHQTSLTPQLSGIAVCILEGFDDLPHTGLVAGEHFAGGCVLGRPPARTSFIRLD